MQCHLLLCLILSLIFQELISFKVENKDKNIEPDEIEAELSHEEDSMDDEVLLKSKAKRSMSNYARTGARVIGCLPQPIQDCKYVYVDGELKYVCTIVGYTVCN